MENKKPRRDEPDYVTNKVLIVFGVCAGLMIGLNVLVRQLSYISSFEAGLLAAKIVIAGSAVLAAASFVWYLIAKKKGKHDSRKLLTGPLAMALCLLVLLVALFMYVNPAAASKALYTFIPGFAVLYLIYSVYRREFFVICVTHVVAVFAFSNLGKGYSNFTLLYFAGALALCAAALGLFLLLYKSGGVLKFGKSSFQVFNRDSNPKHIVPSYVVVMAVLMTVFFLSGEAAYYAATYAMYATIAYLAGLLIYNTVKLI